jgi:hypothetical protein
LYGDFCAISGAVMTTAPSSASLIARTYDIRKSGFC